MNLSTARLRIKLIPTGEKASRGCWGKHPLLPLLLPRAPWWVKVSQWGASPHCQISFPVFGFMPGWEEEEGDTPHPYPKPGFSAASLLSLATGPPWDMEGDGVRGPPEPGSSLLRDVMGLEMWVLPCLLQARGGTKGPSGCSNRTEHQGTNAPTGSCSTGSISRCPAPPWPCGNKSCWLLSAR